MEYCCEKFAEQAGATQVEFPWPDPQFELEDGEWVVHGCCGGGCNIINGMKFCPYCGAALNAS